MLKRLDSKVVIADFIRIEDMGKVSPEAKTHLFNITNRNNGVLIGIIKWHNYWRKYSFFPMNCVLESVCLQDIAQFMVEETEKRKKSWKP